MRLTDEEIMGDFIRGNDSTLNKLVSRYRPMLRRYIKRRVKDWLYVEEIIQHAFVRVTQHKQNFEEGKLFRPWLFTIVDRLTMDHVKARERRRKHERPLVDHFLDDERFDRLVDPLGETPGTIFEQTCNEDRAMELLDSLPEQLKLAVQLVVFDGKTSREAGVVLGVSHVSALKFAQRGLALIQTAMRSDVRPKQADGDGTSLWFRQQRSGPRSRCPKLGVSV